MVACAKMPTLLRLPERKQVYHAVGHSFGFYLANPPARHGPGHYDGFGGSGRLPHHRLHPGRRALRLAAGADYRAGQSVQISVFPFRPAVHAGNRQKPAGRLCRERPRVSVGVFSAQSVCHRYQYGSGEPLVCGDSELCAARPLPYGGRPLQNHHDQPHGDHRGGGGDCRFQRRGYAARLHRAQSVESGGVGVYCGTDGLDAGTD